jgi:NAD(P)-dependent dehydrogenase (short-subunit alcohol dehydrogenase family)
MAGDDPIGALARAALVTGAARRIGRALAEDLAANGFAVAVHYHRSAAEAEQVVRAIAAKGGRAVALGADLAREGDTAALLSRAAAALGPIGVLVNNASVFERDDALTVTRASWDAHLEPNLRAPFVLTQEFARLLPPGAEGVVVNMIDQRVWNLTPYFTSYTLSKSGLWTLTRTLALALAPRIRVNAIGPGPALPSARQSEAQFRAQCARTPLRRGTTTAEICAALRFILSAPAMTGQMIALDGGQHLGWAPEAGGPAPPEE